MNKLLYKSGEQISCQYQGLNTVKVTSKFYYNFEIAHLI